MGRLLHSHPKALFRLFFHVSRVWWVWVVPWASGVEREKVALKKMGGKMLLLPLFSACTGEEEGLWCRSNRHHLLIPFFF